MKTHRFTVEVQTSDDCNHDIQAYVWAAIVRFFEQDVRDFGNETLDRERIEEGNGFGVIVSKDA